MSKLSIAARFFWASAIGLVVALLATGLLLSELYSRALERTFDASLDFQLTTLVGQVIDVGVSDEGALRGADPRFAIAGSGWYWEVEDVEGNLLASSDSVFGTIIPAIAADFDASGLRSADVAMSDGTRLRVFQRRLEFPQLGQIAITVTGNWSEVQDEVTAFRSQAILVLAFVGLILAILSFIVARLGLQPLKRLRLALESIRAGEMPTLEGSFPAEIAPLADEVNELLRSNAQIVERARGQVGNLAHGLKTPLAVMRNDARANVADLDKSVLSQTGRMSRMVTTYLDRAQLSARSAIVGQRTDAGMIVSRLAGVMTKLYRTKAIRAEVPAEGTLWFRGDAGDLEELCGNLVDNACKWAASSVSLRAAPGDADGQWIVIEIEDDGPGLEPEEIEKVLRRGVRLDEKTPGTGLGLDIVKELVDIYGGQFELKRADLGGLRVNLTLPAARATQR
ncbi:MAG: HAMP domain-containing histidine kinase [Alphaproteobacteria bacterium]|nr:HAMP domain-containing histidine kinase [Alphaproteobacteria bacterium]